MLMIPERSSGSFYPCHRSPFPSICIHVTPRRAWPKPYIDRMVSLLCSPSQCFTPCYGDRLKAGCFWRRGHRLNEKLLVESRLGIVIEGS